MAIDQWQQDFSILEPWRTPLEHGLSFFSKYHSWPEHAAFNEFAAASAICNSRGMPIKFGPGEAKKRRKPKRKSRIPTDPLPAPSQLSYEEQIWFNAVIPTRLANWHDFFNALCWGAYPLTKAALNARQVAAKKPETLSMLSGLEASSPMSWVSHAEGKDGSESPGRTPEQQYLATFDEAGVIRVTGMAGPRLLIFGHAILDHLMRQGPSVCAMTVDLQVDSTAEPIGSSVDALLAKMILAEGLVSTGGTIISPLLRLRDASRAASRNYAPA